MKDHFLKNKNIIFWIIFALVLLAQVFLQYYGIFKYQYLVPPGDDGVNHYWMAKEILDGRSAWDVFISGGYPPFFHWLIAQCASIFNTDLVKVMLYFTPLLPVLSAISIFCLSKEIFNRNAALISMALYVFAVRSPYQLLSDGGYPNLLSASFFLPMAIFFLLLFIKNESFNKYIYLILFALFSLSTILTHHISSYYLFIILFFSLPIMIILYRSEKLTDSIKKFKKIALVYAVFILISIATLLIINPGSLQGLLAQSIAFGSSLPFVKLIGSAEPGTILNIKESIFLIGTSVSVLGVVSLMLFSLPKRQEKTFINRDGLIIFFVWVIILVVGSRLTFLPNPERLIRDLALPLSILSGGAVLYTASKAGRNHIKALLLVFVLLLSYPTIKYRYLIAMEFNSMQRYEEIDQEIIDTYLTSAPPTYVLALSCDDWLKIMTPGNNVYMKNDGAILPTVELAAYDYVYAETSVKSWLPKRCIEPDVEALYRNKELNLIDIFPKNNSSIVLLRVNKKN